MISECLLMNDIVCTSIVASLTLDSSMISTMQQHPTPSTWYIDTTILFFLSTHS
jgi:hypothetical protein